MNTEEFRQIVGPDIWKRMDYIRRSGEQRSPWWQKTSAAMKLCLCLENLCIFIWILLHAVILPSIRSILLIKLLLRQELRKRNSQSRTADAAREEFIKQQEKVEQQELSLKKLMEENASLKEKLSAAKTGAAGQLCSKTIGFVGV